MVGTGGDARLSIVLRYGVTPSCQNRNEYISVLFSICLVTGLPWPWPALVSMRSKIGLVRLAPFFASACIRAAIFLACMGSTRVSVSPVMKRQIGVEPFDLFGVFGRAVFGYPKFCDLKILIAQHVQQRDGTDYC